MRADWLNYHHLVYFHAAVQEGGVTAAARRLRLAQPTLSAQIRQLEAAIGEPLFTPRGRGRALTPAGEVVYRYADEIVGLGRELVRHVRSGEARATRLAVGVSDALPKLVVHRLLAPVLASGTRLDVREGELANLLTDLAAQRVELVLADAPMSAGSGIRAYNHALGECGVAFFAAPELGDLAAGFPASLDSAPMLVPAAGSALRRSLDEWLERTGRTPRIVAEVADAALLLAFGRGGAGVIAAPRAVADEVIERGLVRLGDTDEVRERFWAISAERRVRHPAVTQVIAEGRRLFS